MPRVQLVLGAGGTRCFTYVGAIQVLEERGWTFSTVSGVSAGAVVGVLVAAGRTGAEIADILDSSYPDAILRPTSRTPLLWRVTWPYSRFKESVPGSLVQALLGGKDPTLGELKKPFASIGLDLVTGRLLVYSTRSDPRMRVSEVVAIATAAPGLYPPHESGGRLLVDGALASECPLWLAGAHASLDPTRATLDPVLALKTEERIEWSRPRHIVDFWTRAVRAGIHGHDVVTTDAFENSAELTIAVASPVREDDFRLTKEQRRFFIDEGRRQVQEWLDRGGLDFSRGQPPLDPSGDSSAAARHFLALATPRDTVFVSYSHEDTPLRDEIARAFRERLPDFPSAHVWADSRIEAGDVWYQEIVRAMHRTRVAVLLVSQAFLSSPFISAKERPFLVDAADAGVLKLLWMNVDVDDVSAIPGDIGRFQALHGGRRLPPGPEPRRQVLGELASAVQSAYGGC